MIRSGRSLGRRAGAAFAGAALLLGGAGLTVLTAPAAFAGVTTPTVHCVLPANQGEGTGPQTMDVTLTPANAAPGTLAHAVVNLGPGPVNSTQTLNDLETVPSIDLAMSGGATGTITLTGPTFILDTVSGQPVTIPQWETDFVVPNTAQGAVDFTPVRTLTKTNAPVVGWVQTPCDVVSGATSIGSINVQGPGSEQPTLTSPTGLVRPAQPLTFAGLGWPASGTASLSLCPVAGGACIATPFSTTALTISALGELSGTATLAKTGIPNGDYTLTVTSGAKQATQTLTVEALVQSGPRVMTIDPSSGPVGTTVTVKGTNWNANTVVFVSALNDQGGSINTVSLVSSWDGKFQAQIPITGANTVNIRAREGISADKAVILPFTVTVEPPSAAVTSGPVFRGGTAGLTGGHWPGGATVTAQLCDTTGTTCDAAGLTGQSLTVAADGTLSGSVVVGTGVAFGDYAVKVSTSGGQSALAPITVQRTIKATNTVGTLWMFEGWDFGAYKSVYVDALDADGNVVKSIWTFTLSAGYWNTTLDLGSNAVTVRATDTSDTPKTSVYRFR